MGSLLKMSVGFQHSLSNCNLVGERPGRRPLCSVRHKGLILDRIIPQAGECLRGLLLRSHRRADKAETILWRLRGAVSVGGIVRFLGDAARYELRSERVPITEILMVVYQFVK